MNPRENWKTKFDHEINDAENSRGLHNEGRARVCARRAAGIIIGEFLRINNLIDPGPSALKRIQLLAETNICPPEIQEITSHFLVRSNKDYTFPIDADLVNEARVLAKMLLNYNS